jgi:hypothetical protein
MKIVKRILLGIGIVMALLLVTALFVKKEFSAEKEVTINRPNAEVFEYIRHLKNQDNFTVWARMDPNMKKEYRGTDGTVGFVSAWEGNSDVGKGEQEIIGINEGKRVDFELRFLKPFESTSPAYMATEAVSPTQTKVKWGMNGKMIYPLNIMGLFMNMDEMIGKDFETGLNNLKALMEK